MFSYLRPHRRTPSNPTSPHPEQSHSWEPSHHSDHARPQRYQESPSQESPSNLDSPPSLPPITRVSSTGYEPPTGNMRLEGYERDSRVQYAENSRGSGGGRETNTFSILRMPAVEQRRPESAGSTVPAFYPSFQNTSRPQTSFTHEVPLRQPPMPPTGQALPFVTAADLQSKPTHTGRRPTRTRLPTPPSGTNPVSSFETAQPRSGKARLNLLNPMSLLARRRTSNAVPQLPAASSSANRSDNFTANFDPRIRGTVVHDFSAPRRPRGNVSYNDAAAADGSHGQASFQKSLVPQTAESNAGESPNAAWSGGEHTPVFTENFEEEQYPAASPHVRKASDLSDLPLPIPPYAKGAQRLVDPNLAAKNNTAAEYQPPLKIGASDPVSDVKSEVHSTVEEEAPQHRRILIDPAATPPKSTAGSRKGRSRNVSEVSISGLPRHAKSTSSRFSFDMIGAAKQEKLLEDRHRQKALEKKNSKGDDQDEEEDEYDYDDMMDDAGLEERIPGVNADIEEEDEYEGLHEDDEGLEESIPGVNANLEEGGEESGDFTGFTFQQFSLKSPLSPYGSGMASTPRDANGEVIGFAFTKDSPQVAAAQESPASASTPISSDARISAFGTGVQGLGLQGVATSSPTEVKQNEDVEIDVPEFPHAAGVDNDDLYFDDGIIDELGEGDEAAEFDESVFDIVDTDQYGRPLPSATSLPTLYSPPMLTADPSPPLNKITEANEYLKSPGVPESAISPHTILPPGALAPMPSVIGRTNIGPSQVLTQDTLAAYQSALAAAARAAADSGKFDRRVSTAADTLSPSSQLELQPSLMRDSSEASHYEPFSPSYELDDDFDFNDDLEDDPIIAAANAEALANDSDGFYGQEFGFYSAPAASDAEFANGGFFGPHGVEGITRSQSGRVACREPNLTPITERSEYSNRNSLMHAPGSLMSPGLVQLAGMLSNQEMEGDMSLDALLKLRRGAWGGSQVSLHSGLGSPRSAGGAEDSLVGGPAPWGQGSAPNSLENSAYAGMRHLRQNSGFSIGAVSEIDLGPQSEYGSRPESPTLTMAPPARPQKAHSASPDKLSLSPDQPSLSPDSSRDAHNCSPEKRDSKGKEFRKHRYTGSAESISYLKEDDPSNPTGERWVLERRRTGEGGEVEFLGREVVSGTI